ncbi:MAG: HAD family phosphatase [Spirochaetales bacterium]|nr:HAD family phosphatase [Spirochaetales bacterium]
MTKAVIFDMDGVIVDSEPLHYESEKKVLARLGFDFPRETHRKYIGYANEYNFWRDLQQEYGVSLNIQTLILEKKDYFFKHLSHITIIQPALTLLLKLKKASIPIALASSSGKELIQRILGMFSLNHFFPVIQSGDDVENGKPSPDIFLLTARKLKVKPENCIVIEDSLNGVKAGHAAGMTVVAVPNEYTKMLDFSLANYRIESLDEFYELELIRV